MDFSFVLLNVKLKRNADSSSVKFRYLMVVPSTGLSPSGVNWSSMLCSPPNCFWALAVTGEEGNQGQGRQDVLHLEVSKMFPSARKAIPG